MTTPEAKNIRVRMAPSPTGFLHIGTARIFLFNWLFARHHGGKLILRMEDTDAERSKAEHEKTLIEALHWLGIEWDEGPDFDAGGNLVSRGEYGPYRQSENTAVYRKYLEQLLADGHAYYCYCTKEELEAQRQSLEAAGLPPKYSGTCRNLTTVPEGRAASVIRLKIPEIKVSFQDLIHDKVEFDAALLGDIIIARSLDSALFHFAVVVDDYEMKVTHVIRGDDHIANTPKHILIQRALGFPEPIYAHAPLILNPDRSKMSKRTNKASLLDYKTEGYLPDAMVNFLAFLGWHPTGDEEILNREALIHDFDIARVQKAGAVFNAEKLDWLNGQYIKRLNLDELAEYVTPFLTTQGISGEPEFLKRILAVEQERMKTIGDFVTNAKFFFSLGEYESALLVWKNDSPSQTRMILEGVRDVLKAMPTEIAKEALMASLDPLIQANSRGSVLWPLRAALSGLKASPDPLVIAGILGRDESIRRVEIAMEKLSK